MSKDISQAFVQFSEAIWNINAYVAEIIAQNEELNQYSSQQLQTLRIIKEHPDISQSEIAAIQGVFKTAISNRIKKLELGGLIAISSGRDRREKSVKITDKGLHLMNTSEKVIYGHLNDLLSSEFSNEEIVTFTKQLHRINQLLK
ncbi:MarR family transcriptional regulator [Jeotgalibacillus sp. S-D1]|uniref:MarR family winged helix-turn-helix transcriptional regulator n=1 Tax=Jeotgalibacillus sp. S-D1 TaxID=2552189 RepID=UPI00105A3826|nr:MarR family transcriptional regulator [Jeotgalibacillus sp. S-D1]TDL30999.1 MarR family transcriptional regulator [Jeotgalibacillus sp. S-D1]